MRIIEADPDVHFFPPINFVIICHMLAGKALMIDVKKRKAKRRGCCQLPAAGCTARVETGSSDFKPPTSDFCKGDSCQ